MSFSVRDGHMDVVVVAGPRVEHWSTVGARTISMLCAEVGLKVGLLGGTQLIPRGVVPLPQTGGIVMVEDIQRRIHRIQARAVVRLSVSSSLPDPFPGWWNEGLIPLATARRLQRETEVNWSPAAVILGTGNPALSFGADLLEAGVPEVFCVETFGRWGAKRIAGWEVSRRRFEIAGGRLMEGRPIRMDKKSAMLWMLRIEDAQGIRVLEASRVVSAGPFSDHPGVREHPPGSCLFDLEQTAPAARDADPDGWALEEERARQLATKIIRALAVDLGEQRESVERAHKRAKTRLKRYLKHRAAPFTPSYQGKWIVPGDARAIRAFSGVPQAKHKLQPVASIECFESISCNLCQTACPEKAIDFGKDRAAVLDEAKCTACGICLAVCPSSTPILIHEREQLSMSLLTLPWRRTPGFQEGELATLLNRRGETLGSGRVIAVSAEPPRQLLQVQVPTHLIWEARGLEKKSSPADLSEPREPGPRVAITFNGEKRLVRDEIPVTWALFETGRSRPQDVLACPDGSCGLCQIELDGVKKLACRSEIHPKMAIRLPEVPIAAPPGDLLCPCLGITRSQVLERIRQGKLSSPEAVLSVVRVGQGKCHGQICIEAFQRVLLEEGIEASQWVDWRFPWSEWVLAPGPRD